MNVTVADLGLHDLFAVVREDQIGWLVTYSLEDNDYICMGCGSQECEHIEAVKSA